MNQEKEPLVDTETKFDPVSLEFRQIIDDHFRLVKFIDQEDLADLDRQERKEETNRQNLNVVAYCIAFMIYNFDDVEANVTAGNLDWITRRIVSVSSIKARGKRLDKSMYFFLREMIRDYLKNINKELTRIDNQPVDVWQHSYNALDARLKKAGTQ